MTDKKIEYYTAVLFTGEVCGGEVVGCRLVLGMPDTPRGYARFTTPVVSYDETTGIYETKNTVYVPAGPSDSSQA